MLSMLSPISKTAFRIVLVLLVNPLAIEIISFPNRSHSVRIIAVIMIEIALDYSAAVFAEFVRKILISHPELYHYIIGRENSAFKALIPCNCDFAF